MRNLYYKNVGIIKCYDISIIKLHCFLRGKIQGAWIEDISFVEEPSS